MAHIKSEEQFRAEFNTLKWQTLTTEIAAGVSIPAVVCVLIAQYVTNASAAAMSRIVEKARHEISLQKHDHIDSTWFLRVLATESPFCILTTHNEKLWFWYNRQLYAIVRELFMVEFGEFGRLAIENTTIATNKRKSSDC